MPQIYCFISTVQCKQVSVVW